MKVHEPVAQVDEECAPMVWHKMSIVNGLACDPPAGGLCGEMWTVVASFPAYVVGSGQLRLFSSAKKGGGKALWCAYYF